MSSTQTISNTGPIVLQGRDPSPVATSSRSRLARPMQPSGALAATGARRVHITPAIGTELEGLQVREILNAPNSDDLLRDVALLGEACFVRSFGATRQLFTNSPGR
jgi:hypothetical protein